MTGSFLPDVETEIRWRRVPGFPDYDVSDQGQVRRFPSGRLLKPWPDTHGYRKVTLRRGGHSHAAKVSWLVLSAFIGPRPEGHDACHNDGVRTNDTLANLRWDTRAANLADRQAHGTVNRGRRNGQAKLTDDHVIEIRRCVEEGEPQRNIARRFGVSQATVSRIAHRTAWGWL